MIGRRGRAKNKYMFIFCKGKIHSARKFSTWGGGGGGGPGDGFLSAFFRDF